MTDELPIQAATEPAPPATAGAMLRQAREAAGLTVDSVAQQLKLAPRQVRALEDGDYTGLPGRTFVRGFVRNYARLLRIDPEAVIGALSGPAATPALEAPTLQPTAPSIGELPTAEGSRTGWTRWAIPLTLAAIVAAAAVYEWLRPGAEPTPGAAPEDAQIAPRPAAAPAVAPPDAAGTPLPNPVATGGLSAAPAPGTAAGAPAAAAAVVEAPKPIAAPVVAAPAKPPAVVAAPGKPPPVVAAPGKAAPPAPGAAAGDATLALTFRDYSWVEVKDRNGQTLLSRMNAGGTSETISGAPPFDVVIGNAGDVKVTYRGKPVDLAPHTRQNVARLTLP